MFDACGSTQLGELWNIGKHQRISNGKPYHLGQHILDVRHKHTRVLVSNISRNEAVLLHVQERTESTYLKTPTSSWYPQTAKVNLYYELRQALRLYEGFASAHRLRRDVIRGWKHSTGCCVQAAKPLRLVYSISAVLRCSQLHHDVQPPRSACAAPVSSMRHCYQVGKLGIKLAIPSVYSVLSIFNISYIIFLLSLWFASRPSLPHWL